MIIMMMVWIIETKEIEPRERHANDHLMVRRTMRACAAISSLPFVYEDDEDDDDDDECDASPLSASSH